MSIHVYIYISVSLSVYMSLYVYIYLSVSLCMPLYECTLSLYTYLYVYIYLSVSLFLHVSLWQLNICNVNCRMKLGTMSTQRWLTILRPPHRWEKSRGQPPKRRRSRARKRRRLQRFNLRLRNILIYCVAKIPAKKTHKVTNKHHPRNVWILVLAKGVFDSII